VQQKLGVSQRRVCKVLEQPRMTQRYKQKRPEKDKILVQQIKQLALENPRLGYRRITGLLREEGWTVNHKRVYRIWRAEGLKVPQKQRKRRRLGCSDNSCVRKRSEYINHVWSYDFLVDRTADGRRLKLLVVIDEFTRECLSIEVARSITAGDVISTLEYLFLVREAADYIRSDNGPEFVAKKIRRWLASRDVQTLYIEPGSPWENGYCESFISRFRDELLNRELFYNLKEAKVVVEDWRLEYNHKRQHSSLGYITPAAFAAACIASASPTAQPQQYTTEKVDNSLIPVGT
jgi:transposase InsO family protein